MAAESIQFTDIAGLRVGHAGDTEAATGCTVVLCGQGLRAGVDVRGGAPGTRESDLLAPVNLVDSVHAVLLAGGSAFGLDAAGGVMQYLESRGRGFDVGVTRVPIVCGAVLFDLQVGSAERRPDAAMGRAACLAATSGPVAEGSVGAGIGASVGKLYGMARAMKGGLGCRAVRVGALEVGALVVVNCLGDVVDPATGRRLAGLRNEQGTALSTEDTESLMLDMATGRRNLFAGNTTLGVVATNAVLDKAQATKVASMAHDGLARTLRPAHAMVDGDTLYTLASGEIEADLSVVGLLAARMVGEAVLRAVRQAHPLAGLPSALTLGGAA